MTVKSQLVQGGDGTAIPAGFVGQKIDGTVNATTLTNTGQAYTVGTISLTAGVWMLVGNVLLYGPPTSFTVASCCISSADNTMQDEYSTRDLSTNTVNARRVLAPPRYVNVSGATTYYLVCDATHSGGTAPASQVSGSKFYAVRIA